MRKPIVVAICNFLLPGVGYVILGTRTMFGGLLVAGNLLTWVWAFMGPEVSWDIPASFSITGSLIISFAFAYDAYTLANEN